MKEGIKRTFNVNDKVYIIDFWGTINGTQAFETVATIVSSDEKSKKFVACLYGDTFQTYSYNDYGRLIFDTEKEAATEREKIPKPSRTVYIIIAGKIYSRIIEGIVGTYTKDGTYDLMFKLNKGEDIPIKDFNKILFLTREEAFKNKN